MTTFKFRNLRADELEVKPKNVTEKGTSLLVYKTARADRAVLNDAFGVFGWQCKFRTLEGVKYCAIGIKDPETGEWIWKEDCGSKSAGIEPEKSEASDAMKRAGFQWNIAECLYRMERAYVPASKCDISKDAKSGKYQCNTFFSVSDVSYDESGEITGMIIVNDRTGEVVWSFHPENCRNEPEAAKLINVSAPEAKTSTPAKIGKYFCEVCGSEITDTIGHRGDHYSPQEVVEETSRRYGRCLCPDCARVAESMQKKGA